MNLNVVIYYMGTTPLRANNKTPPNGRFHVADKSAKMRIHLEKKQRANNKDTPH
jgi:hypothetical protein